MQIDFHHGVTYVVARLAGFGHREADMVAYCSQYVDDAINEGTIIFDNGAMYTSIKSAHEMLDYRNFDKLANHHVWIPFHFLPGNGGKKAGEDPEGTFIEKIVCRPNSPIAQEMVKVCIEERKERYGLHRLGIALHIFADTWAHQRFAGVIHAVNNISNLDEIGNPGSHMVDKIKNYFGGAMYNVVSGFVDGVLPLGHGAALSYPDQPYLKWKYKDHNGNLVERNNTDEFTEAADEMCKAMQRYRVGNPDADVPGLSADAKKQINNMLASIRDEDGKDRHEKWLKSVNDGDFGFPAVKLEYKGKGLYSWKHRAIGTRKFKHKKSDRFKYNPSFLGSDWKLFHDALLAHRFTLIHDILPKYGICAA